MEMGMENMENGMEVITNVLPKEWREKARELGAFTRAGDYLKTPEDLLRVMLLWADLGTFGHTAAFLRTTGDFPMSKPAIFERARKSAAWLEWMTVRFCREHGYLVEKPEWLEGYRVTVTDATRTKGQTEEILHMMMELFSLSAAEQKLTGADRGESMTNFSDIQKNDLVIADRAYGSVTSMRWMEEREAYYAFRLKAGAFNLYRRDEKGRFVRFDPTEEWTWEEGKTFSSEAFYKHDGHYYPVRICAKGKPRETVEKGEKRLKASKKRGEITHLQSVYNQFIIVATNLPPEITRDQVLELYRMRWQVELLFKRLKSILNYDAVQTRTDLTSRAWLHCKLLTAAICEFYIQRAAVFSPSGQFLSPHLPDILMPGIRSCLRRPALSSL